MAAAGPDDHPFIYSDKYADGAYEYRHVTVPRDMVGEVPKGRIMKEAEWRKLGIIQSCGWEHYAIHKPEPHILLFRRPLGTDPTTGKVDPRLAKAAVDKYRKEYDL